MKHVICIVLLLTALLTVTVLAPVTAQNAPTASVTLTLVGYAVPREAYSEVIRLFQASWQVRTGQQVLFLESYGASGSQSRAVVGGFEADIVGLSIEPDVQRLVDAGLITHDWKDNPYRGIVTDSLVVLAVRPDNPKGINDWADIAKDGVEVIMPDPGTSGGAQWNILAAYGAARRGQIDGFTADDAGATDYLSKVITNVSVLDKDGRESFLTFERGIGDVAITYENEVYAGYLAGGQGQYNIVYPTSTVLIENPVALVDTYVDKHGTREIAQAFIDFLWSVDAQRAFAQNGFRPVNADVAKAFNVNEEVTTDVSNPSDELSITFPPVYDQFTIEEFGSWSEARKNFFGDEGAITKLIAEIKGS